MSAQRDVVEPADCRDRALPGLELERYVPHLIGTLHNRLSALASAEILGAFGIGIVDWRILSTLRLHPEASVAEITSVFEGDKAAVSRALKVLLARGLVAFSASEADPRRKRWRLTDTGNDLHDDLMQRALKREARLLDGLSDDELTTCIQALNRMRENVREMENERKPGPDGDV